MSTNQRSRASTLQECEAEVAELQSQLHVLDPDASVPGQRNGANVVDAKLEAGHRVRQALLENSDHIKDAFRRFNGFQTVIAALNNMVQDNASRYETGELARMVDFDLLQTNLGVLTAALQDHKGNQKYFRQRVKGAGWPALRNILYAMLVSERDVGNGGFSNLAERVFGNLLACALTDESMTGFFGSLSRLLTGIDNGPRPLSERPSALMMFTKDTYSSEEQITEQTTIVTNLLKREIGPSTLVHNADAIWVMFDLWTALEQDRPLERNCPHSMAVSVGLPMAINHIVALSTGNLAALHGTGLLSVLLTSLLNLSSMQHSSVPELGLLATALLTLGISNLDDAHFLYRHACSSSLIADLLLASLQSSRSPSYIHFDLSLNGYASIELPGIGKPFPPASPSAGYTLSLWFKIVRFDPNAHTTIFGAFDASQTCFVLVYLEKDTHSIILQTSVKSSRPSVRFKSRSFREGRWYHIAIGHRRPKATSSSKASLFVDGEFVEQVKSQYPATPPPALVCNETLGSPSPNTKSNAIQAFLGTPQDLASRLGKGLIFTQWRLASANLFADVLSDDLIAVYYQLGPRYIGNYQDCLGSFQTYQASAALNLRNEGLHPGKEERSDIVSAIRSKASALLPESKILLNIAAAMVLDENDENNIDKTQLIKHMSKTASKNLRNITRGGRNALAINGATPSVNEALLLSSGFAVLTGDPTIVVPQSLDDAAWRIGGCAAVGLVLVEAAILPDEIIRALRILFESVQQNWRNSEAMERDNGFGVLSTLLGTKLSQKAANNSKVSGTPRVLASRKQEDADLSLKVLTEILKFVGYRIDRPEDSVINNPLAYRILLVDMEVWRIAEPHVQKLYYEQFIVFSVRSKFYQFNTKRLLRMRIAKKWLEALRGDVFTTKTFTYFIDAFKSILSRSISTDSMRSMALYITYATRKPRKAEILPIRRKSVKSNTNVSSRRQTLSTPPPHAPLQQEDSALYLTELQVVLKILELYAELLCNPDDLTNIKKFARTVTNKWLLHLLADDEPTVVVLAAKILARLLIISGSNYVQKFVEKTGGVIIMQHSFKRWWNIPTMWPICFAILFGIDVGSIDFSRKLDLFGLLETFGPRGQAPVIYGAMLPVITAMLEQGLKSVTRDQLDPDSPLAEKSNGMISSLAEIPAMPNTRQRSMTLNIELSTSTSGKPQFDQLAESVTTLRTVTSFLADIHSKSQAFRDFTVSSSYVQELFFVLFPIVVSANMVSPETELYSRESALTFKGNDVIIRPLSANSIKGVPVVRTARVELPQDLHTSRTPPPKRMSSYILVTSDTPQSKTSTPKLHSVISPNRLNPVQNLSGSIVEELLELTIAVFADQIFTRKDFPGLGLFMRVPPGFQEHQAYFETFILRNTLSHLENSIKLNQKLLWEPRVLTNLARFAVHLGEAIYEGWFINGAEDTLRFLAQILEYLQLPDISSIKAVRLCSQIVSNVRIVLLRVVLLRLSELDEISSPQETVSFLNRLIYWLNVLLPAEDPQESFLKLLCFLVYDRLTGINADVRTAAVNLWRTLLVQKTDDILAILQHANGANSIALVRGFNNIMQLDNDVFLAWVDENREGLDSVLFAGLSNAWASFVSEENRKTEGTAKARVNKRRDKLRLWVTEAASKDEILRRHENGTAHWRSNIHAAEHLKRQRASQDEQESQIFNISSWVRMSRELHGPCGVFDDLTTPKWQLDQTEGRNRMRMRFIADRDAHLHDCQPKRRQSLGPSKSRQSTSIRTTTLAPERPPIPSESPKTMSLSDASNGLFTDPETSTRPSDDQENEVDAEDDFEIVDDPREGSDEYEDKNRKVMRSLQRGDQVEHVHNVSKIVGLEAVEGLLILGTGYLYLLDNLFQRSDGEVVNVWYAPQEERDHYLQMISGREAGDLGVPSKKTDYETRSWRWDDVLSISKRRFLFRDVAIEVFFVDGRSYLLTTSTPHLRNELYQKLLGKAAHAVGSAVDENTWRIESVRNLGNEVQTFGSRLTSVFAQNSSNPATRRWMKGEISNFHYLMLINTMAGRTFNDLTQYPVFPWVLADYTSEVLDLTNPRSFRDLTKPMGCQNPERQAEFKERYQSFAEMGDDKSPPFHYGTHYSSAMIVTSYLIRLQPFADSYLLLQGGSFDHPDRLFYSLEKTWSSASRENMTDVRELIPEFYYLPEFLTNHNHYDFGIRQGNGGAIDTVELPPWANGDPNIFIAKHREALESEYVSQHLHCWIDLIFGHKQRGEAALEAVNVFHHLSYHGAKDLDTIDDPVERLATIGIIHNFGQTPHQVFLRSHPTREDTKHKIKRLDNAAEGLTRLPFPLIETHNRVAYLQYSSKHERLVCSGSFRLNVGPAYEIYMEWGFIDGGVRFYAAETKKLLGLFEHVHQGQLSYVLFADSKTLVTAGLDCTISVWGLICSPNAVDLQPKITLFGHRSAVTILAVSRSFSALLSASSDGQVLLWDLNRLELVRKLTKGSPVECARINDVTGVIMLCRGSEVSLWTLNGHLILEQNVYVEGDDTISSCTFYEGSGNEYLERSLIFTGHRKGVVNVWNIAISEGAFVLEHVKRMHHLDHAGYNIGASITAILPMAQRVYTGDDDGRVYEWDLIQRQ